MVGDAGGFLGSEQVGGGGPEEASDLFSGRGPRVGDVHDRLGAGKDLREAHAGDGVDTRGGGRGHGVVALGGEP
jgi:hypothetical protein